MSPREVRGPCWSVSGYGLYERLFDVRKTGQPLVCIVSGQGRARLSNARATRLDVQASVGFASVRSEYPTCSNKRWYASTNQLSI